MAGTLGLDRVRAAPQPALSGRAWALTAATSALFLYGVVATIATRTYPAPSDFGFRGFQVIIVVPLATVGVLVIRARPRNAVGWLLAAAAFVGALQMAAEAYAVWALLGGDGDRSGGPAAAWLQNWLWVPLAALLLIYVPLLFPDGAAPSRKWRVVAWIGALAVGAGFVGQALKPGPLENFSSLRNPYALDGLDPDAADSLLSFLLVGAVAATASVIVRYRRSRGEERQQLKLFAFAAVIAGLAVVANGVVEGIVGEGTTGAVNKVAQVGTILGMVALPFAAGIAILRYGLFEIDVVISRSLVFGALAVFITGVYVAVVAGVGSLLESAGEPNTALSIVATAIVAVAFQPVRERVHRFANRLVYGTRATPYEVLSEFAARAGETVAMEEQLTRMAQLIAEGTGAERAEVRLRVGEDLRGAATWPPETAPDLDGADLVVPVVHRGEDLGALVVKKPRAEPLSPTEEKLVRDLAGQAGLLLRNARLTAELLDRVEELRASRQRLVTAQDEERRRIERDLHDGAQQQLVALKVQLGVARTLADREGASQAAQLITELVDVTSETLDTIRDLARGIYPPLLAAEGLPAALRTQAAKAPLPVEVKDQGVGRHSQAVESAVYFCCLEAMQNAAKYAGGSAVEVQVREADGELSFAVRDNGAGFDPATTPRGAGLQNMADRLDAVGGTLLVTSEPGSGTVIEGRIRVSDER